MKMSEGPVAIPAEKAAAALSAPRRPAGACSAGPWPGVAATAAAGPRGPATPALPGGGVRSRHRRTRIAAMNAMDRQPIMD